MSDVESSPTPVRWIGGLEDGYLEMIDQSPSRGPEEDVWLVIADADDAVDHLVDGAIRRGPELGTAAAYAVALAVRDAAANGDLDGLGTQLEALADRLRAARPEAVDLQWALDQMHEALDTNEEGSPETLVERLFEEAQKITTELHAET